MALYKKLLEIQQEVDSFVKDTVGANGNYKFASGNKVLGKIRPLMNEKGLLLKQETLDLENTRIDYSTKNGPRSEILSKVKIKFTWIDVETGEKDECFFFSNGMNGWDKGLGSALTYAERYFLLKYFHVPTDEDDVDNKKDEEQGAPPKTGSEQEENKNNKQNTDGFDRKATLDWLSDKQKKGPENIKKFLNDKLKELDKKSFWNCNDDLLKSIVEELKEKFKKTDPADECLAMVDYIERHSKKHKELIDDTLKRNDEPFVNMLDKEPLKQLYDLIRGKEEADGKKTA